MQRYFSNVEDQCSQAMKQAGKEAFESNMHHHDIMKAIAKLYLRNRDCFVQKTVYNIFPELKLSRIFLAALFVNANLSEDQVHVLLSKKEPSELPDDNPNIFKESNIDFWYIVLLKINQVRVEHQPDELDDNFIDKIIKSFLTHKKLH